MTSEPSVQGRLVLLQQKLSRMAMRLDRPPRPAVPHRFVDRRRGHPVGIEVAVDGFMPQAITIPARLVKTGRSTAASPGRR